MKLIPQRIEIMSEIPKDLNQRIERIGRVCYKSEDRITPDTADKFVAGLVKMGHHSVLEHFSVTVRFITDRGISHEIVRHRLASYSQESTRYCNYQNKDMEFIDNGAIGSAVYEEVERVYKVLVKNGYTPQIARAVLPNALKTEIIMTANLREWRLFFSLRCSPKAHPQMRELACSLQRYMQAKAPQVFNGLLDFDSVPMVEITQKY